MSTSSYTDTRRTKVELVRKDKERIVCKTIPFWGIISLLPFPLHLLLLAQEQVKLIHNQFMDLNLSIYEV